MKKEQKIHSVDFKVTASGYGAVNWNGSISIMKDGKVLKNHSMPKIRGFHPTDKNGKYHDIEKIDLSGCNLYVSSNCTLYHAYKEHNFDAQIGVENKENLLKLIPSEIGLVKGYVGTENKLNVKKTAPLSSLDLIDQLNNYNFEQFSNRRKGGKDNNSIFSKTTFGDTLYEGKCTISIEELQFISLDRKFENCAFDASNKEGIQLSKDIEKFLKEKSGNPDVKATFHPNYVQVGTIFQEGEKGILLNDAAMDVLVDLTIDRFKNLYIRQGKGYLVVDNVEVDYNSGAPMRIFKDKTSADPVKKYPYFTYFKAVDLQK